MNKSDSTKNTENIQTSNIDFISLNYHSEIKILSDKAINALVSMEDAIELMKKAFLSLKNGDSYVPLRSVVEDPENTTTIFFKPVFNNSLNRFSVKLISQNESNGDKNIPTITGIVLLHDSSTGKILSILDGDSITSLRTGAVSGLASKYLSRKNSNSLAVFGCGAQGETQTEAVLAVRDIEKVFLYDRNETTGNKLLEKLNSRHNISFEFTDDLSKLKQADIICTATPSTEALFKPEHLKRGVHINAIGGYKPHMQEIHSEIIKACSLYVDQTEACVNEAGDILIPVQSGVISENHILGEIGDVLSGAVKGRKSEDEITVFKSVGVAVQDLFVANAAYEKSIKTKHK